MYTHALDMAQQSQGKKIALTQKKGLPGAGRPIEHRTAQFCQ
jgi:hypothetical protein